MKISINLIFIFFATQAFAAVSITANIPEYPFQVLPSSERQISAILTGGSANTVNWSIASTTGGATATLDCTAGCLPTALVTIGATAGSCSISGSLGSYSVGSTATVTVRAQSVDDTSKTTDFLFNVCAKTTEVRVIPAYQQAFKGQKVSLQSWVVGDTDETGTWAITTQPSGGDGVLDDTTYRDTLFSATVTGRYTLAYTSHSDGTKSATAIVYVSPNDLPSYVTTPNKTQPVECYVDPAFTGSVLEVGAGKTYARVQDAATGDWTPGSIMRVWNTDVTGLAPSTFAEYFQINKNGTPSQPIYVCGMPDSFGNLPVIDGANATGNSGVSTAAAAGYGVISFWAGGYGAGQIYGYYQDGSAAPAYVTIAGLHVKNAKRNITYTSPSGVSGTNYVGGTACLNARSGTYISIIGNDLDNCENAITTAENTNSGWVAITQNILIRGNHLHGSGWADNTGAHNAYLQSFYLVLEGNLIDNYLPTALGSNVKWRGLEGIFRYNYLGDGPQRHFDLVDVQDAAKYVAFENYLGTIGATDCNTSFWCLGDQLGANKLAGLQESLAKDFAYGNIIKNTTASATIHYNGDMTVGLQDRGGVLYWYNNSHNDSKKIFDTSFGGGNSYRTYYWQRVNAQNNIFWTAGNDLALNTLSTFIGTFKTNLYRTGAMSITTPINGGTFYPGGTAHGWVDLTNAYSYLLAKPMETHLYGLISGNFLTTSSLLMDTTTYSLFEGSPAIGAGSTLTGLAAQLPVRYQYDLSNYSITDRLSISDIGAVAYDSEGSDTLTPATSSNKSGRIIKTDQNAATLRLHTLTASDDVEVTETLYCLATTKGGTCTPDTPYTEPVRVGINQSWYSWCYASSDAADNVGPTVCSHGEYKCKRSATCR